MNETVDPQAAQLAAAPAPPQARPPRRYGRILIVVVLAALAIVALQRIENIAPSTTDATRKAPTAPPQTVRVGTAIIGDMPIMLNALGTVTPYETVTVYTQIAGVLQEVGFEEGQIVKKGDFLAQIDPRPYQAALDLAQAQLAKDQALLAQAQSDLERYQTLEKQDSIARQQVADQQFLVTQDKAAAQSDQAQIETAELNISYTRIVSPINGRIGLRLVDPGNLVQPSNTSGLFVITQIDPISVVFSLPEDNIPRIAARLNSGAKLAVTAFDRANVDKLATGALTTFDNQVDVTTGTIKMRARFDNPNGALFPNQFVNVQLLVDTETGAVLAPNAAIQIGASGSFVYAVGDGFDTVAKRDVVDRADRRQADRDRLRPAGRRKRRDRRRRPAARRRQGHDCRQSGASAPRRAGRRTSPPGPRGRGGRRRRLRWERAPQ